MNRIDIMGKQRTSGNECPDRGYDLAGQVIGLAMKVHSALGPGFLESVYQKALVIELREAGHEVEAEKRIAVTYRNSVVGEFVADLLVDGVLIVENKAQRSLSLANEVQLVNYLTATGLDEGVLLNFGSIRLEYKKKFRLYEPDSPASF